MHSPRTALSHQLRSTDSILTRIANFLIYVLNNKLFVKGKDAKYLQNTSHLFIDQIEADTKAAELFLNELEEDKLSGELNRLRAPEGVVDTRRKGLQQGCAKQYSTRKTPR